jgi:hypothetical protein
MKARKGILVYKEFGNLVRYVGINLKIEEWDAIVK